MNKMCINKSNKIKENLNVRFPEIKDQIKENKLDARVTDYTAEIYSKNGEIDTISHVDFITNTARDQEVKNGTLLSERLLLIDTSDDSLEGKAKLERDGEKLKIRFDLDDREVYIEVYNNLATMVLTTDNDGNAHQFDNFKHVASEIRGLCCKEKLNFEIQTGKIINDGEKEINMGKTQPIEKIELEETNQVLENMATNIQLEPVEMLRCRNQEVIDLINYCNIHACDILRVAIDEKHAIVEYNGCPLDLYYNEEKRIWE